MLNELHELVTTWEKPLKSGLEANLRKMKIRDTGMLQRSLRSKITKTNNRIVYKLSFEPHGRFQDMGVRKGKPLSKVTKREGRKRRWYSRIMYGRLNALRGAVGYKMMEQARRIKWLQRKIKYKLKSCWTQVQQLTNSENSSWR